MDFNLQSVVLLKSSFLESDSCTSSTSGPSIEGTKSGTEHHHISTSGTEEHKCLASLSIYLEKKH